MTELFPLRRLKRAAQISGALATASVLTMIAPQAWAQKDKTEHHHHDSDEIGDLPNFHQVTPGIYRGAAPTDKGLAQLKAMGVKTIIDLRIEKKGQEEETKTVADLGIKRIRIPLGKEAPTKKQVATFLATLNDPAQQPVFVHCQHGADRTGAMIGIYRVTHDGWTFDQAYNEMLKYGFKKYLTELKGSVQQRAKH